MICKIASSLSHIGIGFLNIFLKGFSVLFILLHHCLHKVLNWEKRKQETVWRGGAAAGSAACLTPRVHDDYIGESGAALLPARAHVGFGGMNCNGSRRDM